DKKKSILLANAPIAKTLRPCREESVDFDTTENLYIEGDNLDVLKLLQETYLGKIKMIYIDPPYNTGNDFVYNDDFAEDADTYLANSGQFDAEGNRLVQNTESNGRFHTDWLNMIYSRLKLSKSILSDDGLIFISIDENEIENLLKICDEIFGRQNRAGVVVVKSNPRGSMSAAELANLHEYLLIYCKNIFASSIIGHKLTDTMTEEYKYTDSQGKYRLLGLRMRGGFWRRSERPNLYFPIYVNPENGEVSLCKTNIYCEEAIPVQPSTMEDGTWRWSKDKVHAFSQLLIGKKVKRGESLVWDIFQKDYFDRNGERRTKAKSIWEEAEINYQNGTVEIKNLLGSGVFDYSKPVFLLERAMEMVNISEGDIILDFFSGSATTAHAVMQLNSEDGGNRKFIMVQLPEETDAKSEAYKAGYKNICEIGKERIRRAGKKIKEDSPLTTQNLDIGFRVLKLDSTNMKDVYYTPADYEISMFDTLADNIKEDRTPEDLLFQVMLDLGVLLSSKIEESTIAGKKVFNVADGFLMACFDENVSDETITAVAKKKPYYFVMRDSSLASDSVATNFDQIFATYSPDTVRKVL
ncbi:MAG: site-specific DNA-methyltransferase, partial [Oscillospiraceae bacterium]